MLFNSLLYLFFFPAVYLIYWTINSESRRYLLIGSSILFYAVWGLEREGIVGLRWTAHFLGIIILNYYLIAAMVYRPHRKRTLLGLLLFLDLGNLILFKYTGFFLRSMLDLGLPVGDAYRSWDLFLPLAISFYTFQLIAYAVDVFRGVIQKEHTPVKFYLFILFFPQLIAGPIMRSTDFMDQIDRPFINKRKMYDGLWLIMGGIIKKIVLADTVGNMIAPVFAAPDAYNWWSILVAGMGFSLQVYGDFSGYTDMARGSAKLLGYDIPENFTAPFFSRSARELWQRWHITLASWLRDYIYIPLGGNRVGRVRVYLNLIITFTLGGLWHGADYTYVAWGGLWGVLLAGERFLERGLGLKTVPEKNRILIAGKVFIMFVLFSIGAIMFRSHPLEIADRFYSSGEIMVRMLYGMFVNTSGHMESVLAGYGIDTSSMKTVFGGGVFEPASIGNYDSLLNMLVFMTIFHVQQYKPSIMERFRKYDPYLLILFSAIVGGWLLPVNITGSHQFIYFVF